MDNRAGRDEKIQQMVAEARAERRRTGGVGEGVSGGGLDLALLAEEVAKVPARYKWWAYLRRSQITDEADRHGTNYLIAQARFVEALRGLGVDIPVSRVLDADTGKSGALGRKFREDLQQLWDAIDQDENNTVVAVRDVSRLFRDATDREPTLFATHMDVHRTLVLTSDGRLPLLLDMTREGDRERFKLLAKAAARERIAIRERTLTAREQSVEGGGASGGPIPLGYAGRPKISRHESDDGQEHPPIRYVYEPHREVRLQIMRAAMLPHIKTWRALHKHLVAYDIAFPPFDPETARTAFSRSALCRVHVDDPAAPGGRRPLRRDDNYRHIPGSKSLQRLLTDPIVLGDVMIGSGEVGGGYQLRKAARIAEAEGRRLDSLVRVDREFKGNRPDQALCRTEEEEALFWAVVQKWSPKDLRRLREARYAPEAAIENPDYVAKGKRGRPAGSGDITTPWAGMIYCYRHGIDPHTGNWRLTRTLRHSRSSTGKSYSMCDYDRRYKAADANCCLIPELEPLLTHHLMRAIWSLLRREDLMAGLEAEREAAKRRVESLRREVEMLQAEQQKVVQGLLDLRGALAGMDEAFVAQQVAGYSESRVRPLAEGLQARQKDLADAEAARAATPLGQDTATEVKVAIERTLMDWDELALDQQREFIHTFVERVGVLAGEGEGEYLIEFRWNTNALHDEHGSQIRDVLVAWKDESRDRRSWTPEEDEALRRLWPASSGATREDIQAALQPERKLTTILERVKALDLTNGGKSRKMGRGNEFRAAWRESEKNWGERHPAVRYLQVEGWRSAGALARGAWDHNAEGDVRKIMVEVEVEGPDPREIIEMPAEVRDGIARLATLAALPEVNLTGWNLADQGASQRDSISNDGFSVINPRC